MADSRILMKEKVDNTERKFGEALNYFPVVIESASGVVKCGMFTEDEIEKAIVRAEKNREDIPKSLWGNVFGQF